MKRMHVHIIVEDIARSRAFYAALFKQAPTVSKADYAKWMLDDPRVNLSLSVNAAKPNGIEHLGVQVDTSEALGELHSALNDADIVSVEEAGANCCYANTDKHWTKDPDGIVWELFHTFGETEAYGSDHGPTLAPSGCCAA